jgi:hypothetical protein
MPKGGVRPKAWNCAHTTRKHHALGLCRSCWQTKPFILTEDNIDRFMSFVSEDPETGCFIWSGVRKNAKQGGYPMYRSRHAVALHYAYITGKPAPKRGDGVELSHTCVTGSHCANGAHVVVEDHTANMRRSIESARKSAANARAHIKNLRGRKGAHKPFCEYGHARTPDNLRSKTHCRECAKRQDILRHALKGWLRAVTGGKLQTAHKNPEPETGVIHVLARGAAPIFALGSKVNTNHL